MLTPKDILQAAINIAEDLLQQELGRLIKKNKKKTHSFSFEPLSSLYNKESLYDGYAGIGLFFLELYKQTKNERYLIACTQIADELICYCEQNITQNYTFFTGRGGVVYLLTQLFAINYDDYYEQAALALFLPKNHVHQLQMLSIHDLMNGTAGTLLAGLHLHQQTENRKVLSFIEQLAELLIREFNIYNKGMHWSHSHQQILPLCGFAHGNAGIAWVLLELGFYLDNQVFVEMTEQAFVYENHQFNRQLNNYPDFKKGIYTHTDYHFFKEQYVNKNDDFFTQPNYPNKWFSGATGIGLSRLRAFQLLHHSKYHTDVLNCIRTTIETDVDVYQNRPFYLYQGSGGAVDLLLEASIVLQKEDYLNDAQQVAYQAITFNHQKTKVKKNKGLLIGEAGLGYFYLRAFNPYITPSVLCPKLSQEAEPITNSNDYPSLTVFEPELRAKIIQKVYPRTLETLYQLCPDEIIEYLSRLILSRDVLANFASFIEELPSELSDEKRELFNEIFGLEQKKQQLQDAIQSYALLHIKQLVQEEKLTQYLTSGWKLFLEQQVQVHPQAIIYSTKWNWQLGIKEWMKISGQHDCYISILCPSIYGGVEELLTTFTQKIWAVFKQPKLIRAAVAEIQTMLMESKQNDKYLNSIILLRIKQFLKQGVLVFVF